MRLSPSLVLSLDSLLAKIGEFLQACPKVTLEWSLRVEMGTISDRDRLTCWVEESQEAPESFAKVAQLLQAIAAPVAVAKIQAELAPFSVRQGISVAILRQDTARASERVIEWRLYLHTREPEVAADRYRSWRWRTVMPRREAEPDAVQTDRYEFYFLPATPSGDAPSDLVHPIFVNAAQQLVRHERLRSMSGFWLRYRGDQVLQVDLIYPWYPLLAEFSSTLRSLTTVMGASDTWPTTYGDHPIRHIAFSGKAREPGLTVYFSAPIGMEWPSTLQDLKEGVRSQSQTMHQQMEQSLFSQLPNRTMAVATPPAQTAKTQISVGEFYNTERIDLWRQVLGNKMHYHFGLFEDGQYLPDSDAAIDAAFDRAVSELYPFIPEGCRVYDIGCGWGGTILQLRTALGCQVEGITISQTQAYYCLERGLKVRHGTVEETLPPGYFDCMVMIESLSHVQDKLHLLKVLRLFGKRLVIRVHCQDQHPTSRNFGGTMLMNSSSQLRALLEAAGWKIIHWQNRRPESMPSVLAWQQRLTLIPEGDDQHLETLRKFCDRVVTSWDEWGESNPLIELVAER